MEYLIRTAEDRRSEQEEKAGITEISGFSRDGRRISFIFAHPTGNLLIFHLVRQYLANAFIRETQTLLFITLIGFMQLAIFFSLNGC
jgi:hypothetical protein